MTGRSERGKYNDYKEGHRLLILEGQPVSGKAGQEVDELKCNTINQRVHERVTVSHRNRRL